MKREPSPTTHPIRQRFFRWLILFVFIILIPFTAYYTFFISRDLIATWDITDLAGSVVKRATPSFDITPGIDPSTGAVTIPQPTGKPPAILPTPDPWDGASRVTVLVMGLDYGDWASEDRVGPPRSDTMILLTIDPVSLTAGILSIPRDLWVTMPGIEGYHKINTAHRFGELYNMPGGGPGLAMRTVEQVIGVPIQYYARIDFYAFENFIDEIGGVTVDVSEEIKVDPIGEHNTVILKPGKQTLDGPTALGYARNRYTEGGDFDRSDRQQQVILAILDKVMSPGNLPRLVSRAPALYESLGQGIKTNMTLQQAIQLAWLVQEMVQKGPGNAIIRGVIGNHEVVYGTAPDGQAIFKPIPSRIRELRDKIFATGISSPADQMDLDARVAEEAPRVSLVDNTGTAGVLERTTAYFQDHGIQVVSTSPGSFAYTSRITSYTGKPYTLQKLVDLMQIQSSQVIAKYDATSQVDIAIELGADWTAVLNTLP